MKFLKVNLKISRFPVKKKNFKRKARQPAFRITTGINHSFAVWKKHWAQQKTGNQQEAEQWKTQAKEASQSPVMETVGELILQDPC